MTAAEEYIVRQDTPLKEVLFYLQLQIESRFPNAELVFKWHLPCYYLNGKPLCYMNAVPTKKYVDLGFWHGNKIRVHQDKLVKKNRTKVASLRYLNVGQIDTAMLQEVLADLRRIHRV